MALPVTEARVVSAGPMEQHLEAHEIAALVDHRVGAAERERFEAHLAECADCRAEVASVARIVASSPAARRAVTRRWVAGAAAAAVVLVLAWPRQPGNTDGTRRREREAPVTATVAPRGVAPSGPASAPFRLVWTRVPGADSYRARVYDDQGTVVFERETTDTTAAVPDSVPLRRGRSYYWKVEARTGFDRAVASALVEFSLP